jgi:hypothetical protein
VQELQEQGRKDVTLHCDEQGNYEELQCDNGLCWCAEEKTGTPISRILPENMMIMLPCCEYCSQFSFLNDTELYQHSKSSFCICQTKRSNSAQDKQRYLGPLTPWHGEVIDCKWRKCLQRRIVVNILNKHSWTANKGWSASLGVRLELTTITTKN